MKHNLNHLILEEASWQVLEDVSEYLEIVELSEQLISGWQPNLQPEDRSGIGRTWFNLGITWEKLEQKSKAKAAYENARKL